VRLHPVTGGVILNQGAGHSLWFAGSGPNYTTPAGDFSTLVQNGDGTYTRTLPDGLTITPPDPDGAGPLGTPIVTFAYDNANRRTSLTKV
jgi:hypothetical protein